MGMDPHLARLYDTHGAGTVAQQEVTKIATLDLFAQAAAADGIDLSALPAGDRDSLYTHFQEKLAQEGLIPGGAPPTAAHEKTETPAEEKTEEKEKKEEEKKEEEKKEAAARAEYAARQNQQEKLAEADHLGRVMAHAFWNEYQEISKSAAAVPQLAAKGGWGTKGKVLGALGAAGAATGIGAAAHHAMKSKEKDEAPKEASAPAAAYSAFDLQAAKEAMKMAAAAQFDTDQAAQRLEAVLTLGPSVTTKVAAAGMRYEDAVGIRGLELLEQAGYPIDWSKVGA